MRIIQSILVVLMVGSCIFIPVAWNNVTDCFNSTLREVNSGHFDFHPASFIMNGIILVFPALLILALFRLKAANVIAMLLVLYTPFYIAYGNYGVEPRGLHTSPFNLAVILISVIAVELVLLLNLKITRNPNHGLESTGAPPAAGTPETHP